MKGLLWGWLSCSMFGLSCYFALPAARFVYRPSASVCQDAIFICFLFAAIAAAAGLAAGNMGIRIAGHRNTSVLGLNLNGFALLSLLGIWSLALLAFGMGAIGLPSFF